MLYNIKEEIENKLHKQVDLIYAPIDVNSLIKINKVVEIYKQLGFTNNKRILGEIIVLEAMMNKKDLLHK